jgi:hypothetical protein
MLQLCVLGKCRGGPVLKYLRQHMCFELECLSCCCAHEATMHVVTATVGLFGTCCMFRWHKAVVPPILYWVGVI